MQRKWKDKSKVGKTRQYGKRVIRNRTKERNKTFRHNTTWTYLGGDGSDVGLFSEQVHDVGGEFVAGGLVLLQLGVVRASDLRQLGPEKERVNSLLADSYFYNSVWYVPRICAKLALRTKGRKGKMSEKSRKGRKGKSRGKGGEER